MLWMQEPLESTSTCTYHCSKCWDYWGGIPMSAHGCEPPEPDDGIGAATCVRAMEA